jgi:type II secretory pathway pseudopilin PulG
MVRLRIVDEKGFGLLEMLIAMVVLNVGILALVATFQSGAASLQSSASLANGAAVADKVMEVYRTLQNKAIYLNAPTGGGADVSGWPNGIPTTSSSWYSLYSGDTSAYRSDPNTPTSVASYYSYSTPPTTPPWATQNTGTTWSPVLATDTTVLPTGLSIDPTKAVQAVAGPDGQNYPVFTYIVIVKPTPTASGYVKQVTVVVRDPRQNSRVLARQSAFFDPNVAP